MSELGNQSETSEKISINKSTFNTIIIGAVIALAAATFAAGFVLGSSTSEVSSSDLAKADLADQIAALEKKLDSAPTPAAQVRVQPPAPNSTR